MMEHISLIKHNNKGVSMMELIAYVVLYGAIMGLFTSLVFVIIKSAQKVDDQAILNRGATIMYTEILSQTIALNPDTVSDVTYYSSYTSSNTNTPITTDINDTNKASVKAISITFTKKYDYYKQGDTIPTNKNEGDRYEITNPSSITYLFFKKGFAPTGKKDDNIYVIRSSGTESTINLDYGMTISSAKSDDSIVDCIQVATQNTSNKYVTFNGFLHFDNKAMEFNFIIPVFVANVPEPTTNTSNGN